MRIGVCIFLVLLFLGCNKAGKQTQSINFIDSCTGIYTGYYAYRSYGGAGTSLDTTYNVHLVVTKLNDTVLLVEGNNLVYSGGDNTAVTYGPQHPNACGLIYYLQSRTCRYDCSEIHSGGGWYTTFIGSK